MGDFDYAKRASDVTAAQAEMHAAFKHVVNRDDRHDPRTQRWWKAIESFRKARTVVYSEPLRLVDRGERRPSDIDTVDMLDFLEADPIFFGSGYMKEKLLTELKRRALDRHETGRLQAIIIRIVYNSGRRREFLKYCRAAANVDDVFFRAELKALETSNSPDVGRRANWVLAALDGKWLALRRASQTLEKRDSVYRSAPGPRID